VQLVDVVIIGAGPAGSAAATRLAQLGRSVVVIDKATFPRDKICGDGLTAGALRRLDQLGFDPAGVPSWTPISQVSIRPPYGDEIAYPLPDRSQGLFAVVAERRDLDAALVTHARKMGAVVHEGAAVDAIEEHLDGSVTVTASGLGDLHARHVIAADGMWSPTRKLLGDAEPGYRGEWHAFRQYVRNVSGRAATDLVVFFEQDFLPGYFWSFPLGDGRANIGFGIERGGKQAVGDMKELWLDLLERPHVRELLGPDIEPEQPHRAWPIPCRVGRVSLSHGPVLFVGDAAAVCDVMTGEGIGQALQTGIMAAEAINAHWHDPEAASASYEQEVIGELGPDDRMSSLLTRALRHRKGASIALWITNRSDWTRRNFIRWLFEDSPRGLLYTPSRWRRGVLSGRGGYFDV